MSSKITVRPMSLLSILRQSMLALVIIITPVPSLAATSDQSSQAMDMTASA